MSGRITKEDLQLVKDALVVKEQVAQVVQEMMWQNGMQSVHTFHGMEDDVRSYVVVPRKEKKHDER